MTRARNIAKLVSEQVSGNVNISGILTAATLFGDASGLSGLTAVGVGVTILDNGANRGAAQKIDFGDLLVATQSSGGVSTITVGFNTSDTRTSTLVVSGLSTFTGNVEISANLNATGVSTISTLSGLNATLSGLNVTGISTLGSLDVGDGPSELTFNDGVGLSLTKNLNVSGLSTFAGITTITGNTLFSKQLNVSGVSTIAELNLGSGGAKIAGFTTITNGGYSTLGIVTASSFRGDGSQLTGVGNTADVSTSTLVVSGISTFNNTAKFTSGGTGGIGVSLPNTQRIRWGDLGELSIKSDGTYIGTSFNYIDATDGYIYIRNDKTIIRNSETTTERLIAEFNGEPFNGENVKLYYGGNEKFATLGAGVTITGTTFTNQLSVSGVSTAFSLSVTDQSTFSNVNATGVSTISELNLGSGGAEIAGFTTVSNGGYSTVGVVTASSFYGDTSNAIDGRWVLGANGTSDYTFTGIGFTQTTNDPILYLARGRVYEFVNNSGGSHPFQIRVSNGGAAYDNGVTNNGAAAGTIRFEVPFNASNTLYYQCTNHSGMGNTITIYPTI